MHQEDAGSGVLAAPARQAGFEFSEVLLPTGELPSLNEFVALVVLGGSADTDQEDRFPWLRAEKDLISRALERGLPTLGLCLGAQLIAAEAGGTVGRLPVPEIGWREVTLTPAAARDPVLGWLGPSVTVFQWHRCGFSIPPGAEILASNEAGIQAFRAGNAWGLQFHPEVTAAIVDGWIDDEGEGAEARAAGVEAEVLRAEVSARISGSMAIGRGLFERFLTVAAGRR